MVFPSAAFAPSLPVHLHRTSPLSSHPRSGCPSSPRPYHFRATLAPSSPPSPSPTDTIPTLSASETVPWANGGPMSTVVNALINSPLYALMKPLARRVLMSTAEKKGIVWRADVDAFNARLGDAERAAALRAITNPDLVYPEYYLSPFHAYADGNLNWLAAFEAGSATMSMGLRCFKNEVGITADEAFEKLRSAHVEYIVACGGVQWFRRERFVVVDAGCGVGMSSMDIRRRLVEARKGDDGLRIVGLDASPYMLAIAEMDEGKEGIEYVHALAEDCGLEDGSVDWWSLQFILHEMPSTATKAVFEEAFRVLKPGGVLSFIDNDPASPVIRGLPPPIATLMKSTEPFSDQYYMLDVVQLLTDVGFVSVTQARTDHRHRTVVAIRTSPRTQDEVLPAIIQSSVEQTSDVYVEDDEEMG